MDELTRWVEDNEAEIMEAAILSTFAEGVQLRLQEWVYRVRDHGIHMHESDSMTFLGAQYDAVFTRWLWEAVKSIKVEVRSRPALGLILESKWDNVGATVVVTREELDLSSTDINAFRLFCEVQALRIMAVWAEHTHEDTIQDIAATRRRERSGDLNVIQMALVKEAREQKEVVDRLRGVKPSALTKDVAQRL